MGSIPGLGRSYLLPVEQLGLGATTTGLTLQDPRSTREASTMRWRAPQAERPAFSSKDKVQPKIYTLKNDFRKEENNQITVYSHINNVLNKSGGKH